MATLKDIRWEDYTSTRDATLTPDGYVESGRVPFWGVAPDAWNTIVIAGRKLPGIASVSGKAFEVRADKKSVPGVSGERLTTLGREPCDPEIHVRLWTAEHLRDFVEIVALFLPKSTKQLPPPVDVIHPALAIFKVRSVRIMSCTFPEEKEKDVFEVKMRCREFVRGVGAAASTKPKTDTSSLASLGQGEVPREVAAKEARLAPDQANGNAPRTKGGPPRGGSSGGF